MSKAGLINMLDDNARRTVRSVRTAIENHFDFMEATFNKEISELEKKFVAKQKELEDKIYTTERILRNNSDERIALDMKVQMLEKQLFEKQQMLDRFLPAEKSVERYCSHCNSIQKFNTNN